MRYRTWEIIVFVILIVVAITFSLLSSIWSGMNYFTIGTVIAAFIVFIDIRLFYIINMKKEYDAGLDLYLVELYNNNLITKQQLNQKDARIVSGYYKLFRKLKLINIFILIVVVLFVISLIFSVLGVF